MEGDCNIVFYHMSVMVKCSKKNIRCLKNESGEWCWDQDKLLSLAFRFFFSLYFDDSNLNAVELSTFSFLILSPEAYEVLAKPFDEGEVLIWIHLKHLVLMDFKLVSIKSLGHVLDLCW